MIWIIIVAIIVFIAFKIGSTSGQVVGSVNNSGGMRVKYARLLENILVVIKTAKSLLRLVPILGQEYPTMVEQLWFIFNNQQVIRLSFSMKLRITLQFLLSNWSGSSLTIWIKMK